MPRNISLSFRRTLESSFADEVDLVFLTISHPTLIDPIRIVWDTKYFIKGGLTFIGFPFEITLLTDDEQAPQATLTIQNVTPRIGDAIRELQSPPRLKMELLCSADFNLTVDPRTEIGTATVIYSADKLFLTNVSVDILNITGTIVGWDYLQRTWPGQRAMQANFPGLFR
jgi:Domain of unknown function (DUF1833)